MRPLNLLIDAIIRLVPADFPSDFVDALERVKEHYAAELSSEEDRYFEDLCYVLNEYTSTVNTEWTDEIHKLLSNEINYLDVLNA